MKQDTLTGGAQLIHVMQEDPRLGTLLARIISYVGNLAKNSANSAAGEIPAPPPIGAINVKVAGEIVHVTHSDASPIQRGIQYFTEVDTDPNFTNPHVIHHGSSRTALFPLPTKDDNGNPAKYYLRGYSQYHGSQPSSPVSYGNSVTMGGTTQMTLLSSTGSGTASPTGGQGGWGLGKVLNRPAQGPKRNL